MYVFSSKILMVTKEFFITFCFVLGSFKERAKSPNRKQNVAWSKKFFSECLFFSKIIFLRPSYNYRGCKRRIRKIFEVKIWKESLLVKEQTIPQQKALDLSFSLASWKWAWHYHEAATPSHRRITFFTPRQPMLFTAREHGALLMMPSPLSGCQIKAEIKGFLLMNSLFLY